MPYGSLLTDTVQSSTAGTPPQFNDGNGTQVGTLCRAWVNFNGTSGSVAVKASFNVSSITRNGTGDYTINLTNALPDTNYAFTAIGRMANASGTSLIYLQTSYTKTTSAFQFGIVSNTGSTNSQNDSADASVLIFR